MIINKSVFALVVLIVFTNCSATKTITSVCNCDLEPEKGNCRAMITKYYYDKKEGKCKEFIWGGCDGAVPFETLEECKECECNK
jgi:hypothetical protein